MLDGASGLWCVNAGHGRPEIAEAVAKQLLKMDYAPTFQMGHPLPFEAAHALKSILPEAMDGIFFTNSGSESADTSLKIALAYHVARGDPERNILVGRERGYHGVNFGGISVGGIAHNRAKFGPLLPNVDHLRHTHDPARNAFSKGQPEYGSVAMAEETSYVCSKSMAPTASPPSLSSRWLDPPGCSCRRRGILSGCARSAAKTGFC